TECDLYSLRSRVFTQRTALEFQNGACLLPSDSDDVVAQVVQRWHVKESIRLAFGAGARKQRSLGEVHELSCEPLAFEVAQLRPVIDRLFGCDELPSE